GSRLTRQMTRAWLWVQSEAGGSRGRTDERRISRVQELLSLTTLPQIASAPAARWRAAQHPGSARRETTTSSADARETADFMILSAERRDGRSRSFAGLQ